MVGGQTLQGQIPGRLLRRLVIVSILVGIILGGYSIAGAAIPAPPDEHTLTQPDGATFNATQWGAEHNHGWETTEGYTILKGDDGWWRYATVEDGRLTPSIKKVGISSPPASIPKHVRGTAHGNPALAPSQNATPTPEKVKPVPTTGTTAFPVILINYPDRETTVTPGEFDRLLFGDDPTLASGPGSMQDYFEEASHGQLTVTAGEAGVTGWVTADHPHDYYGDTGDARGLVREAVRKTDDEIDYSKYDNNGDGYVDGVIIVHQGSGQEVTGDPTDIWSHRSAIDPYETDDGVRVSSYSIQPETTETIDGATRNSIGVFAHETGHLLGMTDLYDRDYSSSGIGAWGLMGAGSYNEVDGRQGSAPAHPVAFHKWEQGWITPEKQSPTGPMGRLTPYAQTGAAFQWFNNPNGPEISQFGGEGEYFLAENRQQVGFDSGLPGEGVIITHIDESRPGNNNEDHPMVDIEAADGEGTLEEGGYADPGDPFPGETDRQTFTSDTNRSGWRPTSRFYNFSPSGLEITEFSTRGDDTRFGEHPNDIVLNPAPVLTASAETIAFNITETDNTTTTETVTVRNDGTEGTTLGSVNVVGPNADAFTVETVTDNTSIAPGEATDITISFTRTGSIGTHTATAQFSYSGQETLLEIPLEGTVKTTDDSGSDLAITADSVTITPNESAAVTYSVTNNGLETVTASTVVNTTTLPPGWAVENISGTDPTPVDQFPVIEDGSEVAFSDIGAGETVTVTVTVTPSPNATDGTYSLTADLQRNNSSVGTATASITVTTGDIVAQYDTDGDGIETAELLTAIQDWRGGEIETQDLLTLIDVWRSNSST